MWLFEYDFWSLDIWFLVKKMLLTVCIIHYDSELFKEKIVAKKYSFFKFPFEKFFVQILVNLNKPNLSIRKQPKS